MQSSFDQNVALSALNVPNLAMNVLNPVWTLLNLAVTVLKTQASERHPGNNLLVGFKAAVQSSLDPNLALTALNMSQSLDSRLLTVLDLDRLE